MSIFSKVAWYKLSNQDTFKKGSVELLVLALLREGDLYGYQLSQLVKERSENVLTIPEGSMYPTLYRLTDKGYISDEKRLIGKRLTRTYYHLEPKGRDYLDALLNSFYTVNKAIERVLNYDAAEQCKNAEGDSNE